MMMVRVVTFNLTIASNIMKLNQIIELTDYPISDLAFAKNCKQRLDQHGALILPNFLTEAAIKIVVDEGKNQQPLAFYSKDKHNVYLRKSDFYYPMDHPRNMLVQSSKGCITDDQIATDSPLRTLYNSPQFRQFLATVLGQQQLYNYADPLSSINLHYAAEGQELGWHFDESSFAITLLIQSPESGGQFEYLENMRDADNSEMNYQGVATVLSGQQPPKILSAGPGTLTLFRGRNAIHRVTPTEGDRTRMLVVLAYNSQPGIKLSESARITFYGRL
jgi:alkylated DNA repair dioxygenase AlkB